MSRVSILTDSTADVPAELAERLNITIVPAYVQIGGESLRDGDQITRAEFYRRLPTLSVVPTTAVPPPHEFAQAFRSLRGTTDHVMAVLVAASLSGMLNTAHIASHDVQYPKIHLIDSGQVSMGLGWQAIIAAEAAARGQSSADILALIEHVRPRVRVLAMLDTLEYLHRSGRVRWAQAMAVRLLRIKPLLEVRDGAVNLLGRVRTRSKAIEQLLEMVADLGRLERLAVLHTAAKDVVQFRERLGALFPLEQIVTTELGPIVGSHVGPNGLGIAAVIAA